VHGGLAQGIAQALFEEANYDDQGTLVNATFVDYTIPSAADLPSFTTETVSTPATSNPLGVKGVGEAGTIASTPAILNGVLDAVRHLGVDEIEMPTTSQRVWRALQVAKGRNPQETPSDTHSPGAGLGSIDPNNPKGEVQ
jgi:carbon-monoxide dehydrogenase large subunit